jgi:hypothetical protein
MTIRSHSRRRERGQAIVIIAGGLVALLAMAGLVVDGGNAFAQQRGAQNGIDAASEAGAVELAKRMLGLPPTGPGSDIQWDQRVLDAVNATASGNGLTSTGTAQYTDYLGNELGPVGAGTIPANTQGVHANGKRDFSTFFARVLGLAGFTASVEATAVTGFGTDSSYGGVMPLTFPLILSQCQSGGGSNRIVNPYGNAEWPYGPENPIAIPLCSNGPGNVGWIDWTPPYGGASEIADSIRNPNNPPITTPKWYYVVETGDITSLDNDMDTWEGKDILFPIYDAHADDPSTPADESILGTCDATPTGTQTLLGDCPAGQEGLSGGQGWYFFVTFGEFHLEHSYIQGNHQAECNDPSLVSTASTTGTTNPLNNCLIGYFKSRVIASNLTVGSGTTPTSSLTPVAVQLIK